jgi:hypothetical protein
MTLGEKSATVGGEPLRINNAFLGQTPASCSFSDVVEQACEKLMDRQIKYSIQRIQEMDLLLCNLEKELDDFLFQKDGTDHNKIHAVR